MKSNVGPSELEQELAHEDMCYCEKCIEQRVDNFMDGQLERERAEKIKLIPLWRRI